MANGHESTFDITKGIEVYGKWSAIVSDVENAVKAFDNYIATTSATKRKTEGVAKFEGIMSSYYKRAEQNLKVFRDFIIYSPENNELRKFEEEGQNQPLGIHGAGLFKLLKTMDDEQLNVLKKNLKMIDWFKDFKVSEDPSTNQRRIQLEDRYIAEENAAFFDQRNANEGFLFLLFYLSLFVSQYTPKFFAIDNIDNALNPRLCRDLI